MADLTIRGLPEDLHSWLKEQAQAHHRSVNREAIALLETLRDGGSPTRARPTPDEILLRARRFASLPAGDTRSSDEILGYDDQGLPRS